MNIQNDTHKASTAMLWCRPCICLPQHLAETAGRIEALLRPPDASSTTSTVRVRCRSSVPTLRWPYLSFPSLFQPFQVSFFSAWKVLDIAAVHPRFGCSHVLQVRLSWKNLCQHASWWQRAVGVLETWQTDWPVPLKMPPFWVPMLMIH